MLALPLAAALGALGVLGHAPFGHWYLTVLAYAGLWSLLRGQSTRRSVLLGWLFGLGYFGAGVYWIVVSTAIFGGAPIWLGLLLTFVLCAYLALYPALVAGLAVHAGWLHNRWGWLGVPAAMLLADLLRDLLLTGFPWLAPGYVVTDIWLQRLAPLIGVYGISALLGLWALALLRLVFAPARGRVLAAAVLLASQTVWLLPHPAQWTQETDARLTAAVAQGNYGMDEKWRPEKRVEALNRYREMTLAAMPADLVLWPEVAVTYPYNSLRDGYLAELGATLKGRDATAVLGIVRYDEAEHIYNSLVAIGATELVYDKRHLVPFGEFFPIPRWLRPLMDVLGTPYSDFSRGAATQPPLVVKGVRLGLSICFEDVFPDAFRRDARDAGLLLTVTNDAWFGRSVAAHQHLQIARMRALETGRWIVRAANTGISAVIAPDGSLSARTPQFEVAALKATVPVRSGWTPYARWGDTPLWWFGALGGLLAFVCGRRGIGRGV